VHLPLPIDEIFRIFCAEGNGYTRFSGRRRRSPLISKQSSDPNGNMNLCRFASAALLHDLISGGLELHDHDLGDVRAFLDLNPVVMRRRIVFPRIFDKGGMDSGADNIFWIGHQFPLRSVESSMVCNGNAMARFHLVRAEAALSRRHGSSWRSSARTIMPSFGNWRRDASRREG